MVGSVEDDARATDVTAMDVNAKAPEASAAPVPSATAVCVNRFTLIPMGHSNALDFLGAPWGCQRKRDLESGAADWTIRLTDVTAVPMDYHVAIHPYAVFRSLSNQV
jgi:hypothetical protein